MTASRARYIPEILETHVEELEYLWGQRRAALHSSRETLRDFIDLNERVEAHIQGLLAVPAALPALLLPRLVEDERDFVFAAACPLLRLADETSTAQVLDAFATAEGSRLDGLRDALSFAPPGHFLAAMRNVLHHGDPPRAAAAAVILANHRQLDPAALRLAKLLEDENPSVVELAWLAATSADTLDGSTAPLRPYKQGLLHAECRIRDAAWRSAAWTGQSWTLTTLRKIAVTGDKTAFKWLAALGKPEDLPQMVGLVAEFNDPADACSLLARFGHPGVFNTLAKWMADENVALASVAGEAFTHITGHDVRGQRKTVPVLPDADDFTREFAPSVWVPDMAKARDYWRQHGQTLTGGARWRRGVNLDGECSLQTLASVDLEARWDALARAALAGKPIAAPPPILC